MVCAVEFARFFNSRDPSTTLNRRYPVPVNQGKREEENKRVGLCLHCRWVRQMESDRGSLFYYCKLSETDATFPKYPRLPVLRCAGYEPLKKESTEKADT